MASALLATWLGPVTVTVEQGRIVRLALSDLSDRSCPSTVGRAFPGPPSSRKAGAPADAHLLGELCEALRRYFRGESADFSRFELDLSKLPHFRRRVLLACRKIPRGKTASYAELARRVGSPRAARAVGQAMARNPIPIIIPCHRVIAADGSLGGYGGGLQVKRALLKLEGAP